MSFLGIDIGTTGCKSIVFDDKGRILSGSYREYPLVCPKPGWAELEPEALYAKLKESIREAVEKSGKDPVKALSYSSQGAGPVLLDAKGRVLYNCITALDVRSQEQVRFWEATKGREGLYAITGMPLHTLYSLNQIMWLKENSPDMYRNAESIVNLIGFVLVKWGIAPVMDSCLACSTMAFDIVRGEWSQELLARAGIEPHVLPALVEPGQKVGNLPRAIAQELGLPDGVPVIAGGHDQACAALGAGVMEKGVALDSTGTVEAIVPVWDKAVLSKDLLEAAVMWDVHVVPKKYLGIAANFSAGSVLRWYRDTFHQDLINRAQEGGLDVYDLLLPGGDWRPSQMFVLPHFSGSFSPWCDPGSKGALVGLRLDTTDSEIAQAIVDSVTYEARLIIERFEKAGAPISELRATGGATKQTRWLQLKADIFGKPVVVPDVTEAACLGAALLAAWGSGELPSLEEGVSDWVRVKDTYYPRKEMGKRYDERYQVYSRLYPVLRDFNRLM